VIDDRVIFSRHAIRGNELSTYQMVYCSWMIYTVLYGSSIYSSVQLCRLQSLDVPEKLHRH
jgi:hypothetical protein